jgi:hypothetical protein
VDIHSVWIWLSVVWLFVLRGAAALMLTRGGDLEAILLRCCKLGYALLLLPIRVKTSHLEGRQMASALHVDLVP